MRVVKLLPALVLAVFLVGQSQEAEAQVSVGPQVGLWDMDELAVGGKVQFVLGESFGIEDGHFQNLYGSFDANYILGVDGVTPLTFNVNAGVPFDIDASVTPFAGAGINHWRWSGEEGHVTWSTSASGLNVLGGLEFDVGVPAHVQAQYSTSSFGFLTLSGGVMFGL